ncbi:MAG: DUF885 family protein [Phycisphaerales bacterium]|nr:DUF885 family protein [Phycisphaerales bacterium]
MHPPHRTLTSRLALPLAISLTTLAAPSTPTSAQQPSSVSPNSPSTASTPTARPSAQSARATEAQVNLLPSFIQLYAEDASDISRFYNITWSESRFDRLNKLYTDRQAQLSAIDFDALSQDSRVDYLLMRNKLRNSIAYSQLDRRRLNEMDPLLPFRRTICNLEEQRWRMERIDPRDAAEQIAAIPNQIKKLRERIDKSRKGEKPADSGNADDAPISTTPVLAQRTSSAAGSLRGSLRGWYEYHNQFDPGFSWWVEKPYQQADKAIADYAEYLRKEVAGLKGEDSDPLIGDPIGRETLLADLKNEFIAYSPEELIAIGQAQFDWCEAEMKKASTEMGFGDDWKKALEKVKNSYVDPGEQTHYCTQIVREQIEFLKKNDLITIPDLNAELWRLEMITPDRQKFWPFQYYGGLHIGVGYASDQQSFEDKLQVMRGNNKHFSRIVVPHELIPGHHLQGYMAQRYRPYRGIFSTPFFVEGWCLAWEIKLWNLNWAKSPEDRIGMLFWRMHRGARIIVSLKFHLGQITPPEMVEFLVDRVGHERNNATSEVRRYIDGDYSPLYQVGYLMGGLQITALHDEALKQGFTERQFNDRILTEGSIPVEMVRASVLNMPLTRDYETSWKFDTN